MTASPQKKTEAGETFLSLIRRIATGVQRHGLAWIARRGLREILAPYTAPGRAINAGIRWLSRQGRRARILCGLGSPPANGTLVAFYDLLVEPTTFDVMWFLISAERARRTRGLDALHVVFVASQPGEGREEADSYEAVVSHHSRRDRLVNILVPHAWAVPSVANVEILTDRREARARLASRWPNNVFPSDYSVELQRSHNLDCYHDALSRPVREGVEGVFQASPAALTYVDRWLRARGGQKKAVAITIRHYDYNPARNSNLREWARFALYLEERGYLPVIVPDTQSLSDGLPEPLARFCCMQEAAWTLGLRIALYERAFLNLGINNGPAFLFLTDCRARGIIFKILSPGVPQTEASYLEKLGFEIGGQIPFCTPFQKMVWEDDTFDVIKREFELMEHQIHQADSSH